MIMRIALEDSQLGASIGGRCVSNLCYADDVALIAEDEFTLQELLQNINLASQQYNLDMNVKKTKIMTCAKSDINADIHLNGETVEQVQFVYLSWSLFQQPTGNFEGDQEEIGYYQNKVHSNPVLIEDEITI